MLDLPDKLKYKNKSIKQLQELKKSYEKKLKSQQKQKTKSSNKKRKKNKKDKVYETEDHEQSNQFNLENLDEDYQISKNNLGDEEMSGNNNNPIAMIDSENTSGNNSSGSGNDNSSDGSNNPEQGISHDLLPFNSVYSSIQEKVKSQFTNKSDHEIFNNKFFVPDFDLIENNKRNQIMYSILVNLVAFNVCQQEKIDRIFEYLINSQNQIQKKNDEATPKHYDKERNELVVDYLFSQDYPFVVEKFLDEVREIEVYDDKINDNILVKKDPDILVAVSTYRNRINTLRSRYIYTYLKARYKNRENDNSTLPDFPVQTIFINQRISNKGEQNTTPYEKLKTYMFNYNNTTLRKFKGRNRTNFIIQTFEEFRKKFVNNLQK
ncbi:hypothetical protein M0813_15252 [Anaeramoeba flamelloides]|uniref:Uncharacterized protein n=1 Tax=Anaeramoeba flamelloides TaxID=1746091 RepID=A0ABQ8Z2Q1_9EUKA|nr:hypothetical protein M0813_15252 [Anaeramoeba flamelloides]